ncbi:unnamed protein product [Paramecium octaurelia]|uniref:Uncharacterized protein n=1 Tax=Paramecium octaurelia TaxID=43137 RepID=A0A8S1T6I8_PAROT|nr:unnamed protein product [Paramecium octaurelia]
MLEEISIAQIATPINNQVQLINILALSLDIDKFIQINMTDGFMRASKSFMLQNGSKQDLCSVDVSLDPFRLLRPITAVQTSFEKIMHYQSTDQPYSPNPYYIQYSNDGQEVCNIMNSQNRCLFNNSLEGKLWLQKPTDIQQSQVKQSASAHLLNVSPLASQLPHVEQAQQKHVQSIKEEKHFQKEQLKFFKEDSIQSEEVLNAEESSICQKAKKKNNVRGKRHKHTSDSSESFRISRKKKTSKVNDTKNITKNYSKAIISYIFNNPELVQKIMSKHRYDDFINFLKNKKNQMTNIKQLRDLWVDGGKNSEFNRVFRIISQQFLKSQAVSYVYNSRISNTQWHLKYRFNLLRALREPENFKFIKDI